MPAENGLPQYISKNARSGMYQYYRRPPKGVTGAAFVRSFGSKDRKTVSQKYAAIHDEAEKYFARLITGRTLSDDELLAIAFVRPFGDRLYHDGAGELNTPEDWQAFIAEHGTDQMRALSQPDMERLITMLNGLYAGTEHIRMELARIDYENQREYVAERFGNDAVPPAANAFTLMNAFDQAWKPSGKRSEGTITETKRFVTDFIALNGDHSLTDLTRDHWAKWRANCLEIHGPGWTALKRFSMVKTVVAEAIRAGLFERKNHAGQDVTMRKPARSNLRNEGWSDDELQELFASGPFTVFDGKHRDAEYWVPVIIALTGARLSEVTGMHVPDVGTRHRVLTFFLARDQGKTEESRRIIPVPAKLDDLGLLKYIGTLDPKGPLFPGINSDIVSKWFGRHRRSIGVNRKGCDTRTLRSIFFTGSRSRRSPRWEI